ncbi:Septin, partial [Metschnikowia bicuspidata var. bicuspidata NRRL YB-4993]
KVGLLNLPVQKEMWCKRKGAQFTMILAGCRGTGKTTFLNTLVGEELESEITTCEPMQVRDRKYHLQEDKFDMDLTVVDMPDFGANIDNQNTWLPLVKYIEYQYRSYLIQEEQPLRHQLKDNRVHVCVYFINPTNTELSSLDIESMKEISKRVSLIPVIARSDTLNKDELHNFKNIITKTLKQNEIEVCKYVTDTFATEKINTHSPYAIIGSNVLYTNPDGKLVRARKYGWGMVEVENSDHCDFVHIRDLLMSEHLLDLISAMETHYILFRQRFLRQRLNSAKTALNQTDPFPLNALNGEEDGLASYVMYKKTLGLDDMVMLEKYSGEEEQLQQEARNHLDDIIRKQEGKFREHKAALYTKQKIYNNDLEEIYQTVRLLEKEIEKL